MPDMTDFIQQELAGSTLRQVDLTGASLDRVRLNRTNWRNVDLSDSDIRATGLYRVRMRGVEICDTDIDGELENVRINGVDVVPLIEAELDRRDADRTLIRPTDADGCRAAWAMLTRRWAETVARARRLPEEALHEQVDDEWSFIQTLRHLAFATESWIGRGALGDPSPWRPLSLPWGDMEPTPGVPNDVEARPSLEEALELRADRQAMVSTFVEGLTDDRLAGSIVIPDGPGWPPAGETIPVLQCLHVVFNEEWEHRRYAERDLAVVEERLA